MLKIIGLLRELDSFFWIWHCPGKSYIFSPRTWLRRTYENGILTQSTPSRLQLNPEEVRGQYGWSRSSRSSSFCLRASSISRDAGSRCAFRSGSTQVSYGSRWGGVLEKDRRIPLLVHVIRAVLFLAGFLTTSEGLVPRAYLSLSNEIYGWVLRVNVTVLR